jgi:uncharacterized protein
VSLDEKYNSLAVFIGGVKSAAVAFSGGVDSSFLCYAARETLGGNVIAVTVVSPMLPQSEIDSAKRTADLIGIKHILLSEEHIEEDVAANPRDRCYYCKKIEFGKIIDAARERGIEAVFDGSNTDDLNDWRPGLRALAELKVCSPLREAGLNKEEIRLLSKRFGLPTWNKPAFACLASRIPYGERIDRQKLSRVEKAEDTLRAEGFVQFRVRSHGDIARIEVAREERKRFFSEDVLDRVAGKIKEAGFLFAAFELEGYATGSLNRMGGN